MVDGAGHSWAVRMGIGSVYGVLGAIGEGLDINVFAPAGYMFISFVLFLVKRSTDIDGDG
jgi:hypothetical protein